MRLIHLIFWLYPCTLLPILQLQYQTISQLGWGGWVVLTCNLHLYHGKHKYKMFTDV